jgi:hypothetical protein
VRVSLLVYHVMLYGSIAIGAVALLWYRVRPDPVQVPAARVLKPGAAAIVKKLAYAWLPRLALLGGPVGALVVWRTATDLVIITDGGSRPHAERYKQIGSVPDFTAAHDTKIDAYHTPRDYTWVVNDSPYPVRIETVHYGTAFFGSEPEQVAPGEISAESQVDHIGPGDHPPASVTDEYSLGMDFRVWVTWD